MLASKLVGLSVRLPVFGNNCKPALPMIEKKSPGHIAGDARFGKVIRSELQSDFIADLEVGIAAARSRLPADVRGDS